MIIQLKNYSQQCSYLSLSDFLEIEILHVA